MNLVHLISPVEHLLVHTNNDVLRDDCEVEADVPEGCLRSLLNGTAVVRTMDVIVILEKDGKTKKRVNEYLR